MKLKIEAGYRKQTFAGEVQIEEDKQCRGFLKEIGKEHKEISVNLRLEELNLYLRTKEPVKFSIRHVFIRSPENPQSFIYKHPPHYWFGPKGGKFAPRIWRFNIIIIE